MNQGIGMVTPQEVVQKLADWRLLDRLDGFILKKCGFDVDWHPDTPPVKAPIPAWPYPTSAAEMLNMLNTLQGQVELAARGSQRDPDKVKSIRGAYKLIGNARSKLEALDTQPGTDSAADHAPSRRAAVSGIEDGFRPGMDSVCEELGNPVLTNCWERLRPAFRWISYASGAAPVVDVDVFASEARALHVFKVVQDAVQESKSDPRLASFNKQLDPLLLFMQTYRRRKATGGGEACTDAGARSPVSVAEADPAFEIWTTAVEHHLGQKLVHGGPPETLSVTSCVKLFSRLAVWYLLMDEQGQASSELVRHLIQCVLKDRQPDGHRLQELIGLMGARRDDSLFARSWLKFFDGKAGPELESLTEGITDEYNLHDDRSMRSSPGLAWVPAGALEAQASVCAEVAKEFAPQHRLAATSAVMALVHRPALSDAAGDPLCAEPRKVSRSSLHAAFINRMTLPMNRRWHVWPLDQGTWMSILQEVFSRENGDEFRSRKAKGRMHDDWIYGKRLTERIEALISEARGLPEPYKEPVRRLYCRAIDASRRDEANLHLLQLLLHLSTVSAAHPTLAQFTEQVMAPLLHWQAPTTGPQT